ncbi:MAG: hypothetical protein K8I02_02925, partial [Candidatus Methylomirabilis sp.]|nr:hypothetical protein [Deltaproteobacteria bacterium]
MTEKQRLFLIGIDSEVRAALAEMAEVHETGTLASMEASFVHDRVLTARPHVLLMGAGELAHG